MPNYFLIIMQFGLGDGGACPDRNAVGFPWGRTGEDGFSKFRLFRPPRPLEIQQNTPCRFQGD